MSNDLHKYPPFGDENVDVFGNTTLQGGNKIINENGEILLGAKNVPNELYCIALPNTTKKNGVYSVLNSVSISNIINYKDNVKDGDEIQYNRDGSVRKILVWESGEFVKIINK